MKLYAASIALLMCLVLSAASAQAQVVVSIGSKKSARDCYLFAKSGVDPAIGINSCTAALSEEPLDGTDRAATFVNRGVIEAAAKQPDQALADYTAAIAINPTLGDAYVDKGSVLIDQDRYAEAVEQLNKGLELGASLPQIAYFDRAIAEAIMGRYQDAYNDYKKVLAIDPTFTKASDALKYFIVKPAHADKAS